MIARARAPVTRADVLRAAEGHVGKAFAHGGRGRALDCVGLPLLIAKELRIAGWEILWRDPECHDYPQIRRAGFLQGKLDSFVARGVLLRIDRNRLTAGDLVLRWAGFQRDHHVSLLADNDCLIEARNRKEARHPSGRVVKCAITPADRRSFMFGYQFSEVARCS